jgi:hypothetical protein
MSFEISGYVLEPIRVGQSNSPYTQTPDNLITDQGEFDDFYPSDESQPRTEYMVFVTNEGLLESAKFGCTKNELVQRFDYSAREGRFKPLPGSSPTDVGVLSPTANISRLKVRAPVRVQSIAQAPIRLAVGSESSGTTFQVDVVESFGSTTPGIVQLLFSTGELNWDSADLSAYNGQDVRFQQQQFFTYKDSTGLLGKIGSDLILNPLPATGQIPLLRIGYGLYLQAVPVPNDTSFSPDPSVGTIEWSLESGLLKFNSGAVGKVYYDGVVYSTNLQLNSTSIMVGSGPRSIGAFNTGQDIIVSIPTSDPHYRFPKVSYVSAFSSPGQQGVVQFSSGRLQFSTADVAKYGGLVADVYFGELEIERGVSVRLFRTPVNLDAVLDIKDVTEFYEVKDATLADPVIQSPQVVLPSVPVEDSAYPLTIKVVQGQGSFTSDDLPDLDVTSPPVGIGYFIDRDSNTLYFARRKSLQLIPIQQPTTNLVLPDPLLLDGSAVLELETEPNSGDYDTLVLGSTAILDPVSGVATLTTTNDSIVQGLAGVDGNVLSDPTSDFSSVGVGYLVEVITTAAKGVYRVTEVTDSHTLQLDSASPSTVVGATYHIYTSSEVLADRYFVEVVLLDPSTSLQRTFDSVTRTLDSNTDYSLQPELGLVQLTDRMLAGEEAQITYVKAPPNTTPPTPDGPSITEQARFLIRKERTDEHPTPTTTLSFNHAGRPVASTPAPTVYRGGRPQKLGVQCLVDTDASTITFLPDNQLTDALPHGAVVAPNENVYIDYYVTQAVGGEKTFTVLQPPIKSVAVKIQEGATEFSVYGDQTAAFPADHLLRVENTFVHLIGDSVFDGSMTTVTLAGEQEFHDTVNKPLLHVSSGPTLSFEYFKLEQEAFGPVARGSSTILVSRDRTADYKPGTVLQFMGTTADYLLVSGVSFDPDTQKTKLMVSSNTVRQYAAPDQTLSYSLRPVFEDPETRAQLSRLPVLSQPLTVYRKVNGEVGEILTQPDGYSIDESGQVKFAQPLGINEEFGVMYTGLKVAQPGINARVSYTTQIPPNTDNGLLGQKLTVDYYIRSPDTFFYRVETLTNFRGEYAAEIASAANSGSSGPATSNASQPELFEQGRKSVYFDERHLANQDYVARSTLLFYNNTVNLIEGYRRSLDGTVVGNNAGPFLFDGEVGNTSPPTHNQIDDLVKVSNAPYSISGPPFTAVSIGTYRKYYEPSPMSRFYPTSKLWYGVAAFTDVPDEGSEVVDTGSTNVTGMSGVHTRQAWAVLTESSKVTGRTTLQVDNTDGSSDYARPPFTDGMQVVVKNQDGTVVSPPTGVTVTVISSTQLSLSASIGVANTGATVYQDLADPGIKYHQNGRDFSLHGETGQLSYIPAADGVTPLEGGEALSGRLTLSNTLTAPYKFPALYGGIADDDGELSFPIQTPDTDSELYSYLQTELSLIKPSGLLRSATTPTFIGTATTSGGNTITLTGTLPSPALQAFDLIRILTGSNAGQFRIVLSLSPITLAGTTLTAGSFTYEAAISPTVISGVTTSGSTTTIVNGNFTGVKVGQTIVFTSAGPVHGHRRQVYSVSNTQIGISFVAPAPPTGTAYKIVDPLATYGALFGDYLSGLNAALVGEMALYDDESATILSILDQVFTNVTTGSVSASASNVFNDPSAQFASLGVSSVNYLYIESGSNMGVYGIQSVTSETSIILETALPTNAFSPYRIVTLFGLTIDSVQLLLTQYTNTQNLLSAATAFHTLTSTQVGVSGDTGAFATGLKTSDLDDRYAVISARISEIPEITEKITAMLASTEMLYDKRYAWIDARINLESGLAVQQARAVVNRLKAQVDTYNQLIKLLAVG